MKAISLWQPWATLVALEMKTIETRYHSRFKSLKGQRIAIHVAKMIVDYHDFPYEHLLPQMHAEEFENLLAVIKMHRGNILCTAKIVNTRWAPNVGFVEREEWNRKALCEVAGKYLLFMDEIEPLRNMIPFRGRQGIFNVPDELIGM